MEQYIVTGMSCAACQARVEKAVSKVPGVESCSVSLLTNSMGVTGTASKEEIIKAVTDAGYGAAPKGDASAGAAKDAFGKEASIFAAEEAALEDRETPLLKKRLIASLVFLAFLMYISMGHTMWGWPLPSFLDGNHIAIGIIQMVLAGAVMVINQRFFISGFKGLIHRAPNMDTLVALGSAASFGWSLFVLLAMTGAATHGDHDAMMAYMHDFYFESAAMILTLITVGKMLEARSKGRTTDALKGLMKLAPKTATVEVDGEEREVPIASVKIGDIFVVRPGESIPVDGVITEGHTAVNQAALTGESIPVDKLEGDTVSAATINTSGFIKCRATRVGEDTTLSQIIKMVSDAASTKAPIAKIADRVSGVFVPVVIGIALVTLIAWLLLGETLGFALARAISVLVISCPCALGLATPVAIMVGNGLGAKNGILFKTAASLEETGKTDIIVLDKTGTVTTGIPVVTDIAVMDGAELLELAADGVPSEGSGSDGVPSKDSGLGSDEVPSGNSSPDELSSRSSNTDEVPREDSNTDEVPRNSLNRNIFDLILLAASLEAKSEHPIAKAIMAYADALEIKPIATHEFKSLPGSGLQVEINAKELDDTFDDEVLKVYGGNIDLVSRVTQVPEALKELAGKYGEQGKTPVFFTDGPQGNIMGLIAASDAIKEESPRAVAELKNMGMEVVMLTGDNEKTARAIGDKVGVSRVISGVLPEGKEAAIKSLQQNGKYKVTMVGDGINDAPALTRADMGIAIGAGTDVAIDAADVVLMNSKLSDVPAAIRLSRATLRNIHQNLFWAFFYNCIGIPLAAGCFIKAFGLALNPMFGAAAMSLSSFFVVSNALRLNFFDIRNAAKDKPRNPRQPIEPKATIDVMEDKKMTKTMKIEGMMCEHCEATVKKALEGIPGVTSAEVSHEKGTAVVTSEQDLDDAILKETVEAKEYTVLGIE